MKKLLTLFASFLFIALAYSQSPEKMTYQAVVRDASGNLFSSSSLGMQISILQGSVSGSAVYVETQTPSTNSNGLVTIEVGNGTIVSGDFSLIDWGNGPYFIKTETDPNGGSNYTISGTSQLLSVPYALHAKTADSLAGGVIETDPDFNSSIASGITGTDTTSWNNKLDSYTETDPVYGTSVAFGITGADTTNWNNKQDQLTAGTGIDITNNVVSATNTPTTYAIGDFAQGGIVFYVDETGQHGLVVAKVDQSAGIRWYAGTFGDTRAHGNGPGAGKMNTAIIIASQVAIGDDGNTYAARVCNELQVTEGGYTYADWYLPSRDELILINQNITLVNTVAIANGGAAISNSDLYWSSTETDNFIVQCYFLDPSAPWGSGVNKQNLAHLRAIRAF
ncbi:MAG: hypothetical protein KDC84_13230 [Crocinitomicaceae bacterium]|nr:hypothetical protein [Crocinitomicaceae bacterium]